MKKKALLVGINYVGTSNVLRGCINDVKNIKAILEKQNFDTIETILEKEATTAGIMAGLRRLVDGAEPGDVLFFHYSGHGSQTFSNLEADKLDEIICPIDIDWVKNVIKDDDLKAIFNPVPNGVNVTVILDCCHSGSGLDQAETAIAEVAKDIVATDTVKIVKKSMKKRHMAPPASVLDKIKKKKMVLREWSTSRDVNESALLIAGCMPNQTSADATIDGVPQGALTASLVRAYNQNEGMTYQELYNSSTSFMINNKFTQRPQLDGSSKLYNKKFLSSWAEVAAVPPIVEPTPEVKPEEPKKDKKNLIALVVGAIILVAAIIFLFG